MSVLAAVHRDRARREELRGRGEKIEGDGVKTPQRWGREFTRRAVARHQTQLGRRKLMPEKEFGRLVESVAAEIVGEAVEEALLERAARRILRDSFRKKKRGAGFPS